MKLWEILDNLRTIEFSFNERIFINQNKICENCNKNYVSHCHKFGNSCKFFVPVSDDFCFKPIR